MKGNVFSIGAIQFYILRTTRIKDISKKKSIRNHDKLAESQFIVKQKVLLFEADQP